MSDLTTIDILQLPTTTTIALSDVLISETGNGTRQVTIQTLVNQLNMAFSALTGPATSPPATTPSPAPTTPPPTSPGYTFPPTTPPPVTGAPSVILAVSPANILNGQAVTITSTINSNNCGAIPTSHIIIVNYNDSTGAGQRQVATYTGITNPNDSRFISYIPYLGNNVYASTGTYVFQSYIVYSSGPYAGTVYSNQVVVTSSPQSYVHEPPVITNFSINNVIANPFSLYSGNIAWGALTLSGIFNGGGSPVLGINFTAETFGLDPTEYLANMSVSVNGSTLGIFNGGNGTVYHNLYCNWSPPSIGTYTFSNIATSSYGPTADTGPVTCFVTITS